MFARTFVLTAAVCLMATAVSAKIWRVDSDPTNAADFTTLQEAHDGTDSGDTLYVAGSPYKYDAPPGQAKISISKELTLIGPGYFLGENDSTQATPLAAIVEPLSFKAGSSGSSVMGITADNLYVASDRVQNIVIKRNRITGGSTSYAINLITQSTGFHSWKSR